MADIENSSAWIQVVKKNGDLGSKYPLIEAITSFGSSEESDIRVRRPNIAEQHAEIIMEKLCATLKPHGVCTINNEPISDTYTLKTGDVLEMGGRKFVFGSMSNGNQKTPKSKRLSTRKSTTATPKVASDENTAPNKQTRISSRKSIAVMPTPIGSKPSSMMISSTKKNTGGLRKSMPAGILTARNSSISSRKSAASNISQKSVKFEVNTPPSSNRIARTQTPGKILSTPVPVEVEAETESEAKTDTPMIDVEDELKNMDSEPSFSTKVKGRHSLGSALSKKSKKANSRKSMPAAVVGGPAKKVVKKAKSTTTTPVKSTVDASHINDPKKVTTVRSVDTPAPFGRKKIPGELGEELKRVTRAKKEARSIKQALPTPVKRDIQLQSKKLRHVSLASTKPRKSTTSVKPVMKKVLATPLKRDILNHRRTSLRITQKLEEKKKQEEEQKEESEEEPEEEEMEQEVEDIVLEQESSSEEEEEEKEEEGEEDNDADDEEEVVQEDAVLRKLDTPLRQQIQTYRRAPKKGLPTPLKRDILGAATRKSSRISMASTKSTTPDTPKNVKMTVSKPGSAMKRSAVLVGKVGPASSLANKRTKGVANKRAVSALLKRVQNKRKLKRATKKLPIVKQGSFLATKPRITRKKVTGGKMSKAVKDKINEATTEASIQDVKALFPTPAPATRASSRISMASRKSEGVKSVAKGAATPAAIRQVSKLFAEPKPAPKTPDVNFRRMFGTPRSKMAPKTPDISGDNLWYVEEPNVEEEEVEAEAEVEVEPMIEEPPKRTTRGRKRKAEPEAEPSEDEPSPKKARRGRKPAAVVEEVIEEVVEEPPKRATRATRGRKAKAAVEEVVEEEAKPAPVKRATRGRKAKAVVEEVVEEEAKPAPVKRATRGRKAKAAVEEVVEEEAKPAPVKRATRGRKAKAVVEEVVEEEAKPAPVKRATRGRKAKAVVEEVVEEESKPAPVKRATRGRKAAATKTTKTEAEPIRRSTRLRSKK